MDTNLIDICATNPGLIDTCASAAHEVNRVYCEAIGDRSQPAWENAPAWQRESARAGVLPALAGCSPRELHEGWLRHKLEQGWKYGETKNAAVRTHPCLVPYDDLPTEQRAKDALYLDTVRSVARALGVTGAS